MVTGSADEEFDILFLLLYLTQRLDRLGGGKG